MNKIKKPESEKDSVVRIDSKLLKRVEDYINKDAIRFKYVNKKQFIDLAVLEKLQKEVTKR